MLIYGDGDTVLELSSCQYGTLFLRKQEKSTFLYSAVSSPWIRIYPLADLFIPAPFRLPIGKHSVTLQLLREDYSFRYLSLC